MDMPGALTPTLTGPTGTNITDLISLPEFSIGAACRRAYCVHRSIFIDWNLRGQNYAAVFGKRQGVLAGMNIIVLTMA